MNPARILTVTPQPTDAREAHLIGRSVGQIEHRYTHQWSKPEGERTACQCGWVGADGDDIGAHIEQAATRLADEADIARLDGPATWKAFLLAGTSGDVAQAVCKHLGLAVKSD